MVSRSPSVITDYRCILCLRELVDRAMSVLKRLMWDLQSLLHVSHTCMDRGWMVLFWAFFLALFSTAAYFNLSSPDLRSMFFSTCGIHNQCLPICLCWSSSCSWFDSLWCKRNIAHWCISIAHTIIDNIPVVQFRKPHPWLPLQSLPYSKIFDILRWQCDVHNPVN